MMLTGLWMRFFYQGYGAQAYTAADTSQAATAAYTQAQYAAYYQQQAQR